MTMATINALADANLAQVFKNLPPYDRLRVSEVCRRWCSISQDPWREITRLELESAIPSEAIGAIVRKCRNLTALLCKDRQLILDDLNNITLASLKSVSYDNCSFISHDHSANQTALPLFRSEYGQSMEELVLHEHNFSIETQLSERYSQRLLPNSLKRLQLSGLSKLKDLFYCHAQTRYLTELANLRALECLLVESNICDFFLIFGFTFEALKSLGGLRELSLLADFTRRFWADELIAEIVMKNLPNLEILVLPERIYGPYPYSWQQSFVLDLFVKHPNLRILVIPGNVESKQAVIQVPIRKRFPRGFAAGQLPLLHVFVGKCASMKFRFDDSAENWLRVHPINTPFPELLEREEIAEIFGDSWIAKQIKEGAKRGINFWRYENNLVQVV